jgi:hypothetical protein
MHTRATGALAKTQESSLANEQQQARGEAMGIYIRPTERASLGMRHISEPGEGPLQPTRRPAVVVARWA